ncbi:MAG: hypothetical protein WBC44_19590 [Planctomycetaceae bacterium]
MKLDLQKDERKFRRFVEKRLRDYPVYENLGPGNDADPIALMTVGYSFEQSGYAALVLDTRPDADHDGQWTLHIENETNVLPFPKWCAAFETLCDGGTVDVVLPDGRPRTLDDSDDNESVAALFGETLRDAMQALNREGKFAGLPRTPGAFFIVEEFNGQYGWPDYDDRKSLGRLKGR